jgi:hypothetical protein
MNYSPKLNLKKPTITDNSSTVIDDLNSNTDILDESILNTALENSADLATLLSDETGTGVVVFNDTPTLITPVLGVATGTSVDMGGTTLYGSRAITVDTGGVLDIALGSASGDDFTVDTDKLVVEGDTGNVSVGRLHVGGVSDPGDNNIMVDGSIQIRDSAIYLKSQADTFMDIVADGGVRIGDGVPTNYTMFDPTGHITMAGTAKPWRDALTDAINIKIKGSGIELDDAENVMNFLHTAEESDYLYLNIQFNHDKDLACNIFPHIHYFAALEAVVPNFEVWYRWQVNGDTKTAGWTKLKCTTAKWAAPAIGVTKHQITGTVAGIAPPAGSTLSDIVQFRVIRNHSDTSELHGSGAPFVPLNDPYSATVGVLAFDVHFQISSFGSTDEYTK